MHAIGEHDQVKADQPHVVGERHPRQADVVLVEVHRISVAPRMLASRLACVSTTPLGSLVEPEENWMKAVSSGFARGAACRCAQLLELIDQEGALGRSASSVAARGRRRHCGDAIEQALLGIDERCAELARDAQQLVAVLVADARARPAPR
jgi:hypothetical protein